MFWIKYIETYINFCCCNGDRLCGIAVRVLGCRSGDPGSIPGTTRFSGKKKERKQ
jgi:hypothetical protein